MLVGFVVVALTVAACVEGGDAANEFVLIPGFPVEGYEHPSGIVFPREETAGYGFEGEDVTAPGPTIHVAVGEPVTVTLRNQHYLEDGSPFFEPHNLVVVTEMDLSAEPLWGSATERIMSGQSDSVTFTPDSPGIYYYICSVGDHMGRGMWGEFIVEP